MVMTHVSCQLNLRVTPNLSRNWGGEIEGLSVNISDFSGRSSNGYTQRRCRFL